MEKGSIFSDSLFWFAAGTCLMWVSAVLLVSGKGRKKVAVNATPVPGEAQVRDSLPQRIVVNIVCTDPYGGSGIVADMVVRLEDVLAGNYTVPEHLRPKNSHGIHPEAAASMSGESNVDGLGSGVVDGQDTGNQQDFSLEGFDIDMDAVEEPDFGHGDPFVEPNTDLGLGPGLDGEENREGEGYVDLV